MEQLRPQEVNVVPKVTNKLELKPSVAAWYRLVGCEALTQPHSCFLESSSDLEGTERQATFPGLCFQFLLFSSVRLCWVLVLCTHLGPYV